MTNSPSQVKSNDYYENPRPEMVPFIAGAPKRILEIGCAEGLFRANIIWPNEYWGVEYVPKIAEKAKTNLDKVIDGDFMLKEVELPNNYFDLIICNDVIEHLPDTDKFLKVVARKLAPDGQLVGSVPNVGCIRLIFQLVVRRDWKYESWGILDKTHLRFFTQKSLQRTIEENGWYADIIKPITPMDIPHKCKWLAHLWRPFIKLFFGPASPYFQLAFRIRKSN